MLQLFGEPVAAEQLPVGLVPLHLQFADATRPQELCYRRGERFAVEQLTAPSFRAVVFQLHSGTCAVGQQRGGKPKRLRKHQRGGKLRAVAAPDTRLGRCAIANLLLHLYPPR